MKTLAFKNLNSTQNWWRWASF